MDQWLMLSPNNRFQGQFREAGCAARPLMPRWSHVVRGWGLICFYALIPLSLFGLYFDSWEFQVPTPSPSTVAFVVARATSVAAGALTAIQATAGRLTIGWSDP